MTRVDRLREDGWTECDERIDVHPDVCECGGLGLLPPDGMVYAATRKVFRGVMPAGFQIERVRAALVAAARAGKDQP